MCLIQIGSGSASLDTNIQDGFSNYIVSKNIKKKVLIVEANSIHINNLKKFYKKNDCCIISCNLWRISITNTIK